MICFFAKIVCFSKISQESSLSSRSLNFWDYKSGFLGAGWRGGWLPLPRILSAKFLKWLKKELAGYFFPSQKFMEVPESAPIANGTYGILELLQSSVPVDQFSASPNEIWDNSENHWETHPTPPNLGKYIWATSRPPLKLKFGMEALFNQTKSAS